ncbi:haloacid dehalogenase type II [Halorussus limi]|uniref:Haloacid dehalogenase type II n=1 Tax=Halorussus limi TaxID=2938695 RepID=A0A8U0HWW1_9EURY|nr:haloacid dehalogenase type II [Halorussus limi]UPV75201.1 haloacid dehalogenase type II [Halorussus limi]
MALDTDAVEAIAFDSYGTIVDVTTVEEPLSEHVDDPETVAQLWRDRSLEYAMVGNAVEEYRSFYELIRHALRWALDARGVELDESEREDILSTYHELDVYGDVREGMERLRDAGYDLYVVSNGNEEMLESMVDHADIGDLLEATVSADEVERFKPEPELYRHAADRIGEPPEGIAFVAGGWWDVPGAMHAGMQGIWVDRQDALWGPYDAEPDLTVETFREIADEFDA